VVVRHRVRVLDVEIVAARFHLFDRRMPRLWGLLAPFATVPAPPVDAALEDFVTGTAIPIDGGYSIAG
jgi:hypothetical protein